MLSYLFRCLSRDRTMAVQIYFYDRTKIDITRLWLDGLREVKKATSKTTYYRNIQELKNTKIDFSQKYTVLENKIIQFNPFEYTKVV